MANFVKLLPLVVKSLFYQGNYNIENMHGTGFAWLIRPELVRRSIVLTDEENQRLDEYFTTNPSFVIMVIAIFLKEKTTGGDPFKAKQIYSAAFAALGDSFFWHALRSLLFMVSIFVCVNITPWGIALYPLVYTSFHLFFLMVGIFAGSVFGIGIINIFNRLYFKHWSTFANKASLFVLGILITQGIKLDMQNDIVFMIPAMAAFLIGLVLYKKIKRSIMTTIMLILSFIVLLAIGGHNLWT